MLTPTQLRDTVASIASEQLPEGTIPWFREGRWDPWDHTECALALDAGGFHDEARRALRFLAREQRHDGAWACPIVGGREDDAVLDSNGAAYIATGVWHHYLCTGDDGFLHELWPAVERAIEFTLGLQLPDGTIAWARNLGGGAGDHALLAGCSSVVTSIRCALQIADALGDASPDWELGLVELATAISQGSESFADRSRYSMDWYYPVLSGVLDPVTARARIAGRWNDFVVDGLGARCVVDRPWITSAETAELTIALTLCEMEEEAERLFDWVQYQRASDGSYWTGATFPDGRHFPYERSTWSAAAIVLADAVIADRGATAELFTGRALAPIAAPSDITVDAVSSS